MAILPSPETATEIGAMLLPFVQENYGVELDYSPASLGQVDIMVDDLRRDQAFDAVQPLLFAVGCYLGDVFVRHQGAAWRRTEELGMADLASSPIVVRLPDGRGLNPVGKAYKRFQNGPKDSLTAFYKAVVKTP